MENSPTSQCPASLPSPVVQALLEATDWSATALGARATWPGCLRNAVTLALHARQPMAVVWGPDLHILYNDSYRAILGARAEPAHATFGQPIAQLWPEIAGDVVATLRRAMAGVADYVADAPFLVTRNGGAEELFLTVSTSPILFDDGAVAGVFCTFADTTAAVLALRERDAALAELAAATSVKFIEREGIEERLRLLDAIGEATRVAAAPDAIMEVATRMLGEFLHVTRVAYADLEPDNDRFTIRHDWTAAGAFSTVGVYSLDLFGPRARASMRAGHTLCIDDLDREIARDEGALMFDRIGVKAIICCPLVKGGKLLAMMAVHQDAPRTWRPGEVALVEMVVERCWAHIERVRAMETLRETDRRKSEFLAVLAHELRNPLAPIRNGIDMLRISAGNPVASAKVRDMMERQVAHMVHLINDLLDVARVNNGKVVLQVERVDLGRMLANAIEAGTPALDAARHAIALDVPPGAVSFDADPVRLAQVLGNLLSNAIKYTPPGGRLRLSGRRCGEMVEICLADDGIGIPAEHLASVFDMFTQVSRSLERARGGLGIGLSLVQRLVELHGGTVSAASAGLGQGSTFTVRLPAPQREAVPGSPGAPVQEDAPAPQAVGGPLRILVADDNVDAADTMCALLDASGYVTRVAYDGAEALAIAGQFRPQLAFLDLGMPRMDGFEAARRLRAEPALANMTLVAVTGWGAATDRARSREAGFDHHLLKPASMQQVQEMLAAVAQVPGRR